MRIIFCLVIILSLVAIPIYGANREKYARERLQPEVTQVKATKEISREPGMFDHFYFQINPDFSTAGKIFTAIFGSAIITIAMIVNLFNREAGVSIAEKVGTIGVVNGPAPMGITLKMCSLQRSWLTS